jgi:hypothetical protein
MQTFLVLRRFNELIPLCRCCGYADDERSNEDGKSHGFLPVA